MNVIRLYCPNPEELLNASYLGAGTLLHVESSATQVGGYAELGTVALVAGTYYYAYYHTAGTPGLWYQTRYSNAGGSTFTAYSTAWQDGGPTTLSRLERLRRLVNPDVVPGSAADLANDGQLLLIAQQVTDLIHTMIERYFLPIPMDSGTATMTFDGQWGNQKAYGQGWGGQGSPNRPDRLFIAAGVRSITSLKLRLGGTGSAQVTVPAANYVIRPTLQERDPGQPGQWIELVYPQGYTFMLMGSDVIEVVGTFGYASVPPLIEAISDRTCLRAWRARSSGLGESIGGPETGGSYIKWAMSYEDNQLLQSHFSEWPLVR
jgi:hypothetical protein